MLRARSQSSICEQEAKFVNDRIAGVEKHFSELCAIFAAFIRKAARLRDKNDEVAKTIHTYAESELINRSLNHGLLNLSATLSAIGDYRDAQVQRLDAKVVAPLSQYATICKHARDDVKNTFAARDKELTKRKQLDRIREKNPRNRQMISQAESELMKAAVEVSRVIKGLEEQIDSFERRKLHDLKNILLDFVTIEMSFHTKAIELLTKAYQDIADIDETKDLEVRLTNICRFDYSRIYTSDIVSRFSCTGLSKCSRRYEWGISRNYARTRFYYKIGYCSKNVFSTSLFTFKFGQSIYILSYDSAKVSSRSNDRTSGLAENRFHQFFRIHTSGRIWRQLGRNGFRIVSRKTTSEN
ncbi:protein FAM92A-B-like isoform X3 [Polistes fuscatus]|uniref:protein FAM92A-B-like isoform X3 n=1 Tax=Polistes fuscatus TaxID=30207 RepID=UPI001CA9A6F4|nr:protein FAM92A-B-like isoform X3 [Polistes fuscatus]XP_043501284.1 protein FAM92A-B-like isoform X3 [Polistes fuscatus]